MRREKPVSDRQHKKFRPHYLNKGKLHLNSKGSKLLNDTFIRQLSHVLNWQENDISNISLEECRSHVSNVTQASDCISVLKALRSDNSNKLIFAHANINSIRNKFEFLSTQVKGNIDVLMVSETKVDDSFPVGNFVVDGFSTPYQLDRDSNGGGMLYVREDIPSNLLATDEKNHIESFYVELNLRNEKWLIYCSYNPNKTMICNHLDALSTYLDLYSATYEKILILGDLNVGIEEQHVKAFCDNFLTSLIKQPTCYKNPNNLTCIDLILSNTSRSLQNTCVIETGLSDFHLMTLTVMKKIFRKFQPRLINYRSYKNFSNEAFRECLLEKEGKTSR